tara:strand:+ start:2456 stop:3076 length:621 start_codon:yes stop_codon:yes gene_type:complete
MAKSKAKSIADLLPEGLSEETVDSIASLVTSVVEEQVEDRMQILDAKVHAYLRMKIDEVKEQALTELEYENDTFRNAKLFENLKSYMSIEMSRTDEASTINALTEANESTLEEVSVLTEEISTILVENNKLEQTLAVLTDKIKNLEGDKEVLQEEVATLEEVKEQPFKSSEEALVISDDVDKSSTNKRVRSNEFLTEEVLRLSNLK